MFVLAVPRGIQPVPVKAHHPDPVIEFVKDIYKKVVSCIYSMKIIPLMSGG